MTKLVNVKSKQPNLKVRRSGEVSFEYHFESEETIIKMPTEHADIVTKNPTFYVVGKEEEGHSAEEKEKKKFAQELTKIKGIGEKTAKDIVAAYVTKENLIQAVRDNYEMPFDDDVVESLKKTYGGK